MALFLVATPIGNPGDITLRAKELLQNSTVIILEEFKESTRFLRSIGVTGKTYEQLNEHSTAEDLHRLAALCKQQDVALITDCGTPGFCDPGAHLVQVCRAQNIPVKALPGASSLMCLLALSSQRLDQFVFRGFLPAENEARSRAWLEIQKEKRAFVLMDTPYRFQKMLGELKTHLNSRKVLITTDLTSETEKIFDDVASKIIVTDWPAKAEFMVLVYAI